MKVQIDISNHTPAILVNSEPVTFADGIRSVMEYKKWNKDDMAHYLKVSPRTIDGWLNGRKPSNSVILALSFMLG